MALSKILKESEAVHQMDLWRSQGLKLVMTNGCFDILHPGHIKSLESARDLGDRLIVALNSDISVKRNKGTQRPIIDQKGRAEVLAAFQSVDLVIIFDETTPERLIEKCRPHVLVKGEDYELDNIAGAKSVMGNGGRVVTLPLVEGYSTTELIKKIKDL